MPQVLEPVSSRKPNGILGGVAQKVPAPDLFPRGNNVHFLPPKLQRAARKKTSAAVQHQLVLRDLDRCTFVAKDGHRCEERRWTEQHHLIHVAHGGKNDLLNLTTLCSGHHKFVHQRI